MRLNEKAPGIEINTEVEPTVSQYNVISRLISSTKSKGKFYVDFTDSNGNYFGSLDYERTPNASEIIYDIKDYFKSGELRSRDDIRYSLPSIDRYTEKQYNNFGWVRANDVLTAAEYNTLLSRYADYKHNKDSYPVTRFGEAVIHSTEHPNVIMYVNGSIKSLEITKVVRINHDESWAIPFIKEEVLSNERKQDYQPFKTVENYFGQGVFNISKARDYAAYREYRTELERSGSTKGDTASGTEQDRRGSTEQNKRTGRADPIDGPAYSLPDDSDGIVNQDNNELLDEAYENTGKTAERGKSVAELKRDVKRLRTLLSLSRKETHGIEFDPAKVEKAARGLLRCANSKYDVAALTDELGDLYRYIAKGEDVTYDEINEKASAIAEKLYDNMRSPKPDTNSYFYGLKQFIQNNEFSLTDKQKDEIVRVYGSLGNFVKQNMGRLKYRADAVPLDILWNGEWSENYPGVFDKDENEENMPLVLAAAGKDVDKVFEVLEQTMSSIKALHPRLFESTLNKIKDL